MWHYFIYSNGIKEEGVLKDLGIWVDSGLNFSDHIAIITSSAKKNVPLYYSGFF